jgi:phage/plasmid-associated DNA primase
MHQEGVEMSSDRAEILRGLKVYHRQGDTFEIRIPGAGKAGTISGYFTDFSAAADAALGRADEFAIYVTINSTNPRLIARAKNRLVSNAKSTTSDVDISKLNWLPVDGDPPRPAGISATDEEHDISISRIRDIRQWLIADQGWPADAFVIVDSGNGGYLLIRIELENNADNSDLVKKCLEALDYLYSDETFHVDTTSANPARILRVPGTMNAKGDEVGDMRHRMAQILEAPDGYEVVPKALLEALTAMLPEPEAAARPTYNAGGAAFDPVAYCQAHGLQVHHTKPWTDRAGAKCTVAVLEQCIFNPDHHLTAVIIGWPNGMRSYRCRHNSCLGKHWKDAKAIIEPDSANSAQQQTKAEEPSSQEPPFQKMSREDWANYPKLEDLTKATKRMIRINPDTGFAEPDPITGEVDMPKRTISPAKSAQAVTKYMPLRISIADTKVEPKLWKCDGKIWTDDGEKQVKNLIDAVAGDLSYLKGLQETLRRIRGISATVTFDRNPFLFPALDKVIDLKTGLIRDYQPDDYITYQYGAAVEDPSADYRPVLWALCSSAQDPRDVLTALDIATAACIRQALDAIIQLIGPGANGKGIFERILIALCTASRVAAITLTEAKSSRFGPGAVLGKDIWILSEVEDVQFAINLLKKVATGERMDSDVKYGDRIQGKPHVLPILDCNIAVDFGDDSWGRERRIVKLDYPHTFDYTPGTRRKDPHLEEKVTSPSALAGLLQIIAARAPFLCESRRIYSRKRPEDMAAEYKRQQDSLKYFCEDCLTTEPLLDAEGRSIDMTTGQPWPGGVMGKLTTDALYTEYMTYCRLLNVPVPAGKSPFGKYINATFEIISVSTTQNKVAIRYYPGLMLAKTAKLAFAELSSNYSNYRTTTGELQEGIDEKGLLSLLTTATTGEWPKEVIEEIVRMFCYIESCENPQDISYSGYVSKLPFPVVAVVKGNGRPDGYESPVVFPSLPCSSEPETCSFEYTEAEQVKAQDAHFKDVAEKYTGKPDQTDLQMGLDQVGGKEAAPSPAPKEDNEIARLRAGHAAHRARHDKYTCSRCGKHDDIPFVMRDYNGFYCETCRRDGPPPVPAHVDVQVKLSEVA